MLGRGLLRCHFHNILEFFLKIPDAFFFLMDQRRFLSRSIDLPFHLIDGLGRRVTWLIAATFAFRGPEGLGRFDHLLLLLVNFDLSLLFGASGH